MQSLRNFIHYLFSVLLWILFGYYWYVVSGRRISLATFQAVIILAIVSLLGLLATALWVQHNKRIARRNRRAAPPAPPVESHERDYLGRPVVLADGVDIRQARVISINLDPDGNKVYAVSGAVKA